MALGSVAQHHYKEFAERAAKLEQQAHWKEAALYWEQAEECAKKQDNKLWALHRKEHCVRKKADSHKIMA